MSDIRSKMQKKKEKSETKTGSVISGMIGSDKPDKSEDITNMQANIPDNTADTSNADDASKKESETLPESAKEKKSTAKETKKAAHKLPTDNSLPKEEPPVSSVLEYKSVPNENKTRRKQILFYPSLCAELEQIAKETGSSVNDLINQVMLDYVNRNPSAKTMKKRNQ